MNAFVMKQLKTVNAMLGRWMKKRSREYHVPDGIEIVRDISYIPDGRASHLMDIYRPHHTDAPLPVIVNLHGGGLLLCTKDVNRPFCCEIAKRGFLVFSVDYPLVPEADIPGMIRDVSAGMDVVNSLLSEYGGDPKRVYLVGDSAGALLAVYAAAAQKNTPLAAAIGMNPNKLNVQALALISGMYYTTSNDNVGLFLKKDFYGQNWKRHPMMPYVHPDCPEVAGNLPPCFLITSKLDNLRHYTMKFHRGLQAVKNDCQLLDFPKDSDLQHDFMIVKPEHPAAQDGLDKMCAFLLQHSGVTAAY